MNISVGETESFKEEIDVSQFNIKYDEANDRLVDLDISFGEFYEMLVYCSPRSYYLISENGTFDYYFPYVENGIIQSIYPIYSYLKNSKTRAYNDDMWLDYNSLSELMPVIEDNMSDFDVAINDIKSTANAGDSDFAKLIKYHDYMIMNYNYDWDSYFMNYSDRTNNTAISLIQHKKGLCEAFAILYNYLMMDMELDTSFVTSYDSTNNTAYHTWNMVKLAVPECGIVNPEWFHLDVTWDENATEIHDGAEIIRQEGQTSFNNFLMSADKTWSTHGTEAIKDAEVYYTTDIIATNTTLDNAKWRGGMSRLEVKDGTLYYLINNSDKAELYKVNATGAEEKVETSDAAVQNGLVVPPAPKVEGNTVTIPVNTVQKKPFFVTVKDGDTYKTVAIDTNKDITISADTSVGKIFIWDNAMRPYIPAI